MTTTKKIVRPFAPALTSVLQTCYICVHFRLIALISLSLSSTLSSFPSSLLLSSLQSPSFSPTTAGPLFRFPESPLPTYRLRPEVLAEVPAEVPAEAEAVEEEAQLKQGTE